MSFSWDGWTYGAEHELGDWERRKKPETLGPGWKVDERDITVMNSDGSACDPKGVLNEVGGEINTPPSDSIDGQAALIEVIKAAWPSVTVNHRSNLHCHVRVPGLSTDLKALKRLAKYNRKYCGTFLDLVEPIPRPTRVDYPDEDEYEGAVRRYKRRLVSHHTILPMSRTTAQLEATTLQEFFEAEVPRTKADNKPMWHAQARAAVNVRQLKETDTIEFRHFPGTLEYTELRTCLYWCHRYLWDALHPEELWIGPAYEYANGFVGYEHLRFPKFPPYVHWMERNYRATVLDGTVSRDVVKANLELIRKGARL